MIRALSAPTSWHALLAALVVASGLAACTGPDDEPHHSTAVQPFETTISRSQAAAADARLRADEAARQAREAHDELARTRVVARSALASSDAAISDAVRAHLQAERSLARAVIDVKTVGGVVWLRGQVPTDPARAQAERLARQIHGVQAVRNRLDVAPR